MVHSSLCLIRLFGRDLVSNTGQILNHDSMLTTTVYIRDGVREPHSELQQCKWYGVLSVMLWHAKDLLTFVSLSDPCIQDPEPPFVERAFRT